MGPTRYYPALTFSLTSSYFIYVAGFVVIFFIDNKMKFELFNQFVEGGLLRPPLILRGLRKNAKIKILFFIVTKIDMIYLQNCVFLSL